jgi:methionyl-tRNA formyltransferase
MPTPATPISVYFLGSGRLGVPILQALIGDTRFRLLGIGTQPDRPAGRKRILTPTPVGQFCADNQLEVAKPVSVNRPEFLDMLRALAPEIIVVASFGQLLKEEILGLPRSGCFNVHSSLLPRWRGASPINAAILHGDAETGVCFMAMDRGLDTGGVYDTIRIPLTGQETAETLEETMARQAAARIGDCLLQVCHSGLTATPQPTEGMTYAPKLKKDDGRIVWANPAQVIERQVRGLLPWPRAHFQLVTPKGPCNVQVTQAEPLPLPAGQYRPGDVIQADHQGWIIACGDDALALRRVIPEGRPEMAAADFLRGHRVPVGTNLNLLNTVEPTHETDSHQ